MSKVNPGRGHFSWKVPGGFSAVSWEEGVPTASRRDNIAQDVVDIPGDAVVSPVPPKVPIIGLVGRYHCGFIDGSNGSF